MIDLIKARLAERTSWDGMTIVGLSTSYSRGACCQILGMASLTLWSVDDISKRKINDSRVDR